MPSRLCSAYAMILGLLLAAPAASAATSKIEVDHTNTIPNVIANALIADGEGDDWTDAELLISLATGSIYNDPGFDSDATQAIFWGFVPLLRWDSAVGIADDGTAGMAGPAVCDLIGCPINLGGTGPFAASIHWFNTRTNDTAPVQIGNISMTDDARGTWSMTTNFTSGPVLTSGPVINGVMVPEPASLSLLCALGLALLKRGR